MLIAAVLLTLALGVFGSAAGSWLGESASAGLPSRTDAQQLLNAAVPDPAATFINRVSASGRADMLAFSVLPGAQRPNWTVEEARTGLTAAGWAITEFTVHPSPASITCTTDATSQETCTFTSTTATVTAERDGLILRGTATDFLADKSGDAWTGGVEGELFAARGTAYLPLIITGGLLGALAGWLLTAALAYRMRCLPPGSGRLAVAFTGVTATIAVPAVWAVIVNAVMLGEHLTDNGPVYTLHAALLPGSHLDGVAAWLIPGCTIAAAAAAAITVGILVRGVVREQPSGATQPT
jgi:hypothetical protein